MNDTLIGILIFLAFWAFIIILIIVAILRWALRINTQIFYLKAIHDQLIHLNNANVAARTQEYYEKTQKSKQ